MQASTLREIVLQLHRDNQQLANLRRDKHEMMQVNLRVSMIALLTSVRAKVTLLADNAVAQKDS